jgi:hypothetical protein
MLGPAKRTGARDTQGVQQAPAEWAGAVIEVIREDLEFDREVDIVHGRANGHRHDLRREIQDRVNVGGNETIGGVLGGTSGRADDPNTRGRDGLIKRSHHVACDLVTHRCGIDVVEGSNPGTANEKVRRVDQRATQIANANHHDVVVPVVPERFGDSLDQDVHVVASAARAKGSESREVATHRCRRHARQFTNLLRVDARFAALEPTFGDPLVHGQAGNGGFGELLRAKTRRRHRDRVVEVS